MDDLFIRPINADQTHALRSAVLRPNSPPEDAIYIGDDAPDTLHLGAFQGEKIVGIASIYREMWPLDLALDAFRLRGMAVDPHLHRRGIGALLVRECLFQAQNVGGEMLWCNARTTAHAFYLALGFESVGEEFEIAGIGPHYLMRRALDAYFSR